MEDTLAVAMAPDPGDRLDTSQLAARLASIAAHQDPGFVRLPPASIPEVAEAPRALPISGPVFSSGSTISSNEPPPELPPVLSSQAVTPPPLPVVASPSGASGVAPASGATPPPLPSPELDSTEKVKAPEPAPPVEPRVPMRPPPVTVTSDAPERKRGLGGVVALAALLGVAGVVGLGVVGVAWMVLNPSPVRLTNAETDPTRAKDWSLVAGALGERGVAAERTCGTYPYLSIEVTVDGDGSLRRAELLNYPHEPTRLCVEKALGEKRFPREGKGPVVVAVQLQR
jgi:hypothetical protein